MRHALAPTALALFLVVAGVPSDAGVADDEFGVAVREFQQRRWSAAYGRFVTLANKGDADAARVALFMHRYGPVLFNTHWDAGSDELEDWNRLADNGPARAQPAYMPPAWKTARPPGLQRAR